METKLFKEVGTTFNTDGELTPVFECLECKERTTFSVRQCFNCYRKAIAEHHFEEDMMQARDERRMEKEEMEGLQ